MTMNRFDSRHQWRTHYSTKPDPKPQRPWPELKHPRRIYRGQWVTQPDGSQAHFLCVHDAAPEEEAWHRVHNPERGLDEVDLIAYRKWQRGPVARFFGALVFWR